MITHFDLLKILIANRPNNLFSKLLYIRCMDNRKQTKMWFSKHWIFTSLLEPVQLSVTQLLVVKVQLAICFWKNNSMMFYYIWTLLKNIWLMTTTSIGTLELLRLQSESIVKLKKHLHRYKMKNSAAIIFLYLGWQSATSLMPSQKWHGICI